MLNELEELAPTNAATFNGITLIVPCARTSIDVETTRVHRESYNCILGLIMNFDQDALLIYFRYNYVIYSLHFVNVICKIIYVQYCEKTIVWIFLFQLR